MRGHSSNNVALVAVGNGTLILNSGAKVTMNTTNTGGFGGGIYVNGGTVELNDGAEISENMVNNGSMYFLTAGGGIYVTNSGNINIRGGTISANKLSGPSSGGTDGGGIYIAGNSTVTMTGGIISKNIISSGYRQRGGGIFVSDGSFMKRAASGSSTSGIIYGGTGVDANIALQGNAVQREWGTLKSRNSTLGGYDEISTGNDVGWE